MKRLDRKNSWYLMLAVLLGILAFWGCPKKTEVTSTPEAQQEAAPPAAQQTPTAVETPVAQNEKPAAEQDKEKAPAARNGLQSVYFDFDQSVVRTDAGETMKTNAEWLKANPQIKIRIAGNCDERGTKEYNQALGQRRAANAKKYLIDLGVSPARISLISYGKETPGCTESTEGCWQQNRRDDFVVVPK